MQYQIGEFMIYETGSTQYQVAQFVLNESQSAAASTTRGRPFGQRGTAFNGGRTLQGITHA